MDNLSQEIWRKHYEKNITKLKVIKRKNKKGEDIYRIAEIIENQYSREEKELSPIKRPPKPCNLIEGSKQRFEYWELIRAYGIKTSLTFGTEEEAQIAVNKLTYLFVKEYKETMRKVVEDFSNSIKSNIDCLPCHCPLGCPYASKCIYKNIKE